MPKKILVVDDDDFMRETVGDVLVEKGYSVSLADSGEIAVEKFKNEFYDIILLDLKMQGIDGFQTYQQIKKINPKAKAIIMTAYFYEEIITDCLREGAFGVLYKPLDMDKLLEQIEIADQEKIVMVIDDDEVLRVRLADALRAEGFYVLVAKEKEEALRQVIHVPPHIVISDISKETVAGEDSCTLIQQLVPSVKCVVLVRDQNKSHEVVSQCVAKGTHVCMHKPLDLVQLVSTVRKLRDKG
jgi:DNA-binding NtrC family response regulator